MPTVLGGRHQAGGGVAEAERRHDVERQDDARRGRRDAGEGGQQEQAGDAGAREDPAVGGQGHAADNRRFVG